MATQTRTVKAPTPPPAEVTEDFLSNDAAMALATAEPAAPAVASKPPRPPVPDEETEVETPQTEEVEAEEAETEETETGEETEETEEAPVEETEAPAAQVESPGVKVRRPPQDAAVRAVQIAKDREIAQLKARLARAEETQLVASIEEAATGYETQEQQRLITAGYSEDDAKSIASDRAQLARQDMVQKVVRQKARTEIVEHAKLLTASDIARRYGLSDATVLHQYDSPQAMELAAENMQLRANQIKAKRAKITAKSEANRFDGAVSASGSVPSSQRDIARYNAGARDKAAMAAVERMMQGE